MARREGWGGARAGSGRKTTHRYPWTLRLTDAEREFLEGELAEFRNSAEQVLAMYARNGWRIELDPESDELLLFDATGLGHTPGKVIIADLTKRKPKIIAYLKNKTSDI